MKSRRVGLHPCVNHHDAFRRLFQHVVPLMKPCFIFGLLSLQLGQTRTNLCRKFRKPGCLPGDSRIANDASVIETELLNVGLWRLRFRASRRIRFLLLKAAASIRHGDSDRRVNYQADHGTRNSTYHLRRLQRAALIIFELTCAGLVTTAASDH
ncbi:protein of unknown function [Methylocella tundrae]|uniref:Uncharacterized protein n=1 Tax=Methylocella tundrae TaxID=227605 RepID=A0A4U8YVK1_METTU|nr:protein of unknown function [Methylocella tundrae]